MRVSWGVGLWAMECPQSSLFMEEEQPSSL
jgi:hypothetical protein